MPRMIGVMVVALVALTLSPVAFAQRSTSRGFDSGNLFFGAGLSQNKVSGSDSGTGFQLFGGYSFGEIAPKLRLDVEAGYMDTGKMKKDVTVCAPLAGCATASTDVQADGPWATGVVRYMITPQVELIGRAGYDAGDDDGPIFGIGAGYLVDRHVTLRGEVVKRDETTSYQFNVVYRF